MNLFVGCDDCCGDESSVPCGTAPHHPSTGWPFSESLWTGSGYTTGEIVTYSPSLTGFVSHSSSWSVLSSSGAPSPSIKLSMEASIDIEGVDGTLGVLNYILFDDEVTSTLCNASITSYAACLHAMGSLRRWTESALQGTSSRSSPTLGLIVERNGFFRFRAFSSSQPVSRTQWTRLNSLGNFWFPVIPGASFSISQETTIGPDTLFLTSMNAPLPRLGIGVWSEITAFESPDSLSYRSMEIPSLKIDNLNLDYLLGSQPNTSCQTFRTTADKESAVTTAVAGAQILTAGPVSVSVSIETGFDCLPSLKYAKIAYSSSAAFSFGVFLPMHSVTLDDFWYFRQWGACLEVRTTSGVPSHFCPAVKIGGELYIGPMGSAVPTPYSSSWRPYICGIDIDTASNARGGSCLYVAVHDDIYDYGKPPLRQDIGMGKLQGPSTGTISNSGYVGSNNVDYSDRPSASWLSGSIELGVYFTAASLFAAPNEQSYLIREFLPYRSGNFLNQFVCAALAPSVAQSITIVVTGGACAGTYIIPFRAPVDSLGITSYSWDVATTPIHFTVSFSSTGSVLLRLGPQLQGWSFPSGVSFTWGSQTVMNLTGGSSSSPYKATSVTVTYDFQW